MSLSLKEQIAAIGCHDGAAVAFALRRPSGTRQAKAFHSRIYRVSVNSFVS